MVPLVVERRAPRVHQVGDRSPGVLYPVPQDARGDERGGGRIHPPQSEPDSAYAADTADPRHPVGFVNVGVGVEPLVVELARELHLPAAQTTPERRTEEG